MSDDTQRPEFASDHERREFIKKVASGAIGGSLLLVLPIGVVFLIVAGAFGRLFRGKRNVVVMQ